MGDLTPTNGSGRAMGRLLGNLLLSAVVGGGSGTGIFALRSSDVRESVGILQAQMATLSSELTMSRADRAALHQQLAEQQSAHAAHVADATTKWQVVERCCWGRKP